MQKFPLTEEPMDALLQKARMGVISTVGEDGYHYGTPVNFVFMAAASSSMGGRSARRSPT